MDVLHHTQHHEFLYPAQSAAALFKDLVMVGVPLTQRGTKSPEGVAVDFAARMNGTPDNGTHCRRIQLGNLYFEEARAPALKGIPRPVALVFSVPQPRFPFDLGVPK